MKVVTFNIRCDYGQDGANRFDCRKPLIVQKISSEKPDILCFQEVRPHQAQWLKESFPEYLFLGCGRSAKLDDEQMTVGFLREKYNLVEMRTFWLSETPYTPGSCYPEQSACPRASTELLLQEYESGRVFRILNTHLDHLYPLPRRLGLEQILEYLKRSELFPDAPVVLTGDFNATPESEEMKVFDAYPDYVNVTEGIGITYHGYYGACDGGADPMSIDYIFIRGDLACAGVEKWTDEVDGVYLSDHYPICAQLQWKE